MKKNSLPFFVNPSVHQDRRVRHSFYLRRVRRYFFSAPLAPTINIISIYNVYAAGSSGYPVAVAD